jgi:Transposase, Mutator family
MKIMLTDREDLTSYLRFPPEHHHRIRHSNFIERNFGETRRRTKVIGRFPGGTSCVSIAWAVLDRASRGWRGLTMTPPDCATSKTCAAACCNHPSNCGPSTPRTQLAAPPKPSAPRRNITHQSQNLRRPIYTGFRTPPRKRIEENSSEAGVTSRSRSGHLPGGHSRLLQQQIHHELANNNEFICVQPVDALVGAERIAQFGWQHLDQQCWQWQLLDDVQRPEH